MDRLRSLGWHRINISRMELRACQISGPIIGGFEEFWVYVGVPYFWKLHETTSLGFRRSVELSPGPNTNCGQLLGSMPNLVAVCIHWEHV